MHIRWAIFLLPYAFAVQGQAADCSGASTQVAMNECAAADMKTADQRLNATYNEIVRRLKDEEDTRRLLVASETAWIRFRDNECIFATNAAAGGSIRPMLLLQCKTNLTNDRSRQLEGYLKCEEGDLSCPVPPR